VYTGTRSTDMPGGWDGVDDFPVSVNSTPYLVRVFWEQESPWDADETWYTIEAVTPGETYRISY